MLAGAQSSLLPIVRRLPDGKLPIEVLKSVLDSFSGKGLVVPPRIGVDVGVSLSKGKYVVSSSDPVTGTGEKIGWHAVNVSANDVATSGIMPDTLNVVALLPSKTSVPQIKSLMREIDSTAVKLGISVAGGHTEITPGLGRAIVVVTCFGSGDYFVTAANAKSGDSILMTKTAGIEGTAIMARLPRIRSLVGRETVRQGSALIQKLSILKEAEAAASTGKVTAMHDVTEGGVLGAVYEMSLASHLGFEIEKENMPLDDSTKKICNALGVDPLRLIGSGSLLVSCSDEDEATIKEALGKERIRCTRIGHFVSNRGHRVLGSAGKYQPFRGSVEDELWRILRKHGNPS